MTGAVWNFTKSLADMPVDRHREAMQARIARNTQDRERGKVERTQLDWRPARGRVPYAGREQ